MTEKEKDEIVIKLLFCIDLIIGLAIIFMLFKIATINNETTVWMLEHGRIK